MRLSGNDDEYIYRAVGRCANGKAHRRGCRLQSAARLNILGAMRPSFALVLISAVGLASLWAVDESKPYGRASVVVVNAKAQTCTVLDGAAVHKGDEVQVHLDANASSEALVVALTRKDVRLAHGWRPVMLALKEWDEVTVPAKGEKWVWTEEAAAFEVFVVLFPKNAPVAEPLRKLVARLREPTAKPEALIADARQLREEIQKFQAGGDLARIPERSPTAVGGTLRSVADFPWRDFARKANFAEATPGVIVFRHAPGR